MHTHKLLSNGEAGQFDHYCVWSCFLSMAFSFMQRTDPNFLLSDHNHRDLVQACEQNDLQEKGQQQRVSLHVLEPYALQVLHELVSLVHDRVNLIDQSQLVESTSANDSAVNMKGQYDKTATANLFVLEDDPVAKILWTLDPYTIQNVLLAMAVSLYSCVKLTLHRKEFLSTIHDSLP